MKLNRMKARYILGWICLFLLGTINVLAQTENRLYIPDVSGMKGSTVVLPICMDNAVEVTALQFTLKMPEGVTLDASSLALTEARKADHLVTVRNPQAENVYTFMAYSPTNQNVKGNSGEVMTIKLHIPETFQEESVHQMELSDVVLSQVDGTNVMTSFQSGNLKVLGTPDLQVEGIAADKQQVNPGEKLVVSWTVNNIGSMPTNAGWSERITLVSADGSYSTLLGNVNYSNVLGAGAVLSRQVEVALPELLGIGDEAKIQVEVKPYSDTGEPGSLLGNNTALSDASLTVGKVLYLEIPQVSVQENTSSLVRCKLSRSGSWQNVETFTMNKNDESRVELPETVSISAGQSGTYFYLSMIDNEVLDNDSIVTLAISGNGYEEVSGKLVIEDNEFPTLTVKASQAEINEGETFQLVVTASRVSNFPTFVTLTCENKKRFSYPTAITIPAGETSITIDVTAIDNSEIELRESIAFKVSSEKYNSGECIVLLGDNDMPTLTFTLSPNAVSEADGTSALFGIIKRTDNLDKRVVLKLSDDYGLLSYTSQTVIMEKNQAEVQFNIGVTNNDIVDGERTATVSAAVYSSSCDCSIPNETQSLMSSTVTIIDDDGATLKIKPEGTAMLEGSDENVFIVSHNTKSDKDIPVRISCDKDDILEYEHELIIPAGQTSAKLVVKVNSNDIQDDSNIVTFNVESDGYSKGTCWILITDQTLPDAILSLSANKSEVEAEQTVLLRAVVKNVGNSTLHSATPIQISFSGSRETINLNVGKSLAVGDSAIIEYNYSLPSLTGNYTFEAIVNAEKKVQELIYANNTSNKVAITLLSPYNVTAQVDRDTYAQNDSVVITGTATGNAGKNAQIEVYLINEGSRQTIRTTSDAAGNYSIVWKPLSKQSGHFIVGACYPGSDVWDEMDAFDIYGIKTKENYRTCELSCTESLSGKIVLTNPGRLLQTGLTVVPKVNSDNCVFTFDAPTVIGAGESIDISYTIKADSISKGTNWQQMPLEIKTSEGGHLDYMIYYYVYPQKAKLHANQTSINTTMTYGTPREYPITVRNIGKTETGKISLALPEWIQTVTPREMASLSQGDSTTIILKFMPTDAMQLNVPIRGQIGVNCANGDGTAISFNLTPVSESKGNLKVDVVDEYTFFTSEAPHVSNATVLVKNPSTNEIVAEGKTSEDGIFTTELPEGVYTLTVEAEKHDSYSNTVIVDPGVEKTEEAFISYQAITYSWDVVETGVEDEYEIETIVKYETRVPKPVVIITLPDERPNPNDIIPVIVTNKGLINAIDFNLSLSVNDGYSLEFLNEQSLDVLAPQQSHVFYAKLLQKGSAEAQTWSRSSTVREVECFYIKGRGGYYVPCPKYNSPETTAAEVRWGICTKVVNSGLGGGGNGGYGPGSPTGWDKTRVGGYTIVDYIGDPVKNCDGTTPRNNSDAPVNPIDRDKVDDGDPEELPCDSKEEPKLVYKLVPVSGERYDMNGVAADGVSQVKIVLDPKQSRIPSQNCDKFYGFSWLLLKDGEVVEDNERFGSIEKVSDWEAIYTAPSHFTEEFGDVTTVEAQLLYRHKDPTLPDEYEGWLEESPRVKIEIVRPPVVFIHGLGDNRSCWYNAERFLTETGYYKKRFNYRVDYRETNASTFMSNIGVVSDGIYIARERAATLGYVATKCDLIGHSMGGILARLFVERSGKTGNVNRIITVNTPHSGSELGDMVSAHDVVLKKAAQLFYGKDDIDAVKDLAVESDETSLLVNVAGHFDIPCYAIGTQSDLRDIILAGGGTAIIELSGIAFAASLAGAIADPEPISKALLTVVSIACGELALEGRHLLDDYTQVGEGDLVVSSESQLGGCEASEIIEHGPWHCNSPKDYKVINRIKELLMTPSSESTFSTNWFKPTKRTFKHPGNWELWGQRIWNVLSNVIPSSHWGDLISVGASEWSYLDNLFFECEVLTNHISKAPSKRVRDTSSTQERVLKINLALPDELTHVMSCVYLNGHLAYILQGDENEFTMPSTYFGEVGVKILLKDSKNNLFSDERILNIDAPLATAISIEADNVDVIEGKDTYLSLECIWDDDSRTFVKPDNIEFENGSIASYSDGILKGLKSGKTNATVTYSGLSCNTEIVVYSSNTATNVDSDGSPSICSTVTLSFKQKNVMTRQAFRGTLTVNNGNETTAMKDVKMNLEVRDMDGNLTTSHEFQIDAESLNGFTGNLDMTSGWTLEANGTGVATILFIPTKYAAPTEPKDYSFGGSFSYTDPYTGLTVTHDLNPVTLTVNPSPNLEMTYFMQRDVFGDDPLTETVEPMVPSEFALLINNKGYGDAENMNLTTHQPEIIDNQKGLAITFELISSQLNGGEVNYSLGESMVNDFGTIPAHSQAYAQWWLQSSLLGHFIEYNVKATHLTSRNNPDLSLLDTVTIHELIHGFTVNMEGDRPLRGFLVNDIKDKEDLPDEIYFTDATQQGVYMATGAHVQKLSDTEYLLNVNVNAAGWNYGSLIDPTGGKQKLVQVLRSDGTEVFVDNIWQTDRTLRDGKDPLYENLLHFVGNIPSGGETFYLTFEPKPELELEVETYVGVPDESTVLQDQLREVTVRFNKPIKSDSFTSDDLVLNCQGLAQDVSLIGIEKISEQEYRLLLNEVTLLNGYYVLTVQTAGIEDNEGFKGATGKQATWIQFADGKVTLKVNASPIDGGTVTPKTGLQDYGTTVALEASPAEGFDFLNWTRGGEVLATTPAYELRMEGDAEVVAMFTRKHYDVTIICDEAWGTVTGGGTGIYDYGTVLTLTAEPRAGYTFVGWNVNGEMVDALRTWSDTVRQAMTIEPLFAKIENVTVDYEFQKGWNWFSVNVADKNLNNPSVFLAPMGSVANRLLGQNGELTNDPVAGWTGTLETIYPNQGYRLQVNDDITFSIKGEPLGIDGNTITLENGWNWISYRPQTEMSVGEALKNLVATAHDVVKGKASFAMFDGTSWVGSLTTMSPGAGYLMQSHGVKSFNYPASENGTQMYRRMSMSVDVETDGVPESWQYDVHQYEGNTAIVARLYEKDAPAESGMYLVAAFVDGECRGVSVEKNGYLFLTVHGDVENEVISFIAYDPQTGAYSEINETVLSNKEVVGTFETPQRLSIRATQVGAVDGNVCMTCTDKEIRFYGDMSLVTRLDITDMSGKVQLILDGVPANGVVDASGLAAGVYVVTAHTYSGLLQQKFIRR